MQSAADFVVYGQDDAIQLVVEARNTRNGSPEWAAEFRRNLLVHGAVPQAPYFLLASPRYLYLWKDAPMSEAVLPDYQIDAAVVVPLYLQPATLPIDHLSGAGWEFVVAAWLDELVGGQLRDDLPVTVRHWLVESGLYDAVRDGMVFAQATA